MADIADQADAQNELAKEIALTTFRKQSGPPPCGFCYNCGEELEGDLRWCDKHCLIDWEARQK